MNQSGRRNINCLIMKLFAAVLLIAGAVVADLSPRHVDPSVPFVPRGRAPMGRITNGEVAAPAQFKYQVALSLQMANGNAFCGGSIIDGRWVVTAAHCAEGVLGVEVTLGTNTIKADSPGKQTVYVTKNNIYIHPDWNSSTLRNDIALLKLPAAIMFNEFVQPIKLPAISSSYSSYAGVNAIASGWGKDSDASTTVSEVLRFIEVPVMVNSACSTWYFGNIADTNICTRSGSEHKSTCNGDSGGPLVHEGELIGITSFGIGLGCEAGWPAAFTRATSYLEWIAKTMQN